MTPGPRGRAIFDSRGMAGRIYQEDHYTLLHTKYKSSGPCVFGEEDFFYVFSHDAPGARLAGFIKRTTIYCYTQNMKVVGLLVLEKKIFYVFLMTPPGRGPYGPQGHSWQDL